MRLIVIFPFLLACAALLPGCGRKSSSPDQKLQGEYGGASMTYTQMLAAISNAQAAVPQFIRALAAPATNQNGFAIKKPFGTHTGSEEHLWIKQLAFDGTNFHGRLDSEATGLFTYKKGDPVTVLTNELSDWLYYEDGKIIGGFTLRVLRREMTGKEAEEFDRTTKFKE